MPATHTLPIMEHLITTVPDKLFLWDADGKYLSHHYLRPNLKHFVGSQAFLNKNVRDVLPKNIAEHIVSALRTAFKTQQCQICHIELPLDGIPHRQVVRLFPSGDRILGMVHDIPLES